MYVTVYDFLRNALNNKFNYVILIFFLNKTFLKNNHVCIRQWYRDSSICLIEMKIFRGNYLNFIYKAIGYDFFLSTNFLIFKCLIVIVHAVSFLLNGMIQWWTCW